MTTKAPSPTLLAANRQLIGRLVADIESWDEELNLARQAKAADNIEAQVNALTRLTSLLYDRLSELADLRESLQAVAEADGVDAELYESIGLSGVDHCQ